MSDELRFLIAYSVDVTEMTDQRLILPSLLFAVGFGLAGCDSKIVYSVYVPVNSTDSALICAEKIVKEKKWHSIGKIYRTYGTTAFLSVSVESKPVSGLLFAGELTTGLVGKDQLRITISSGLNENSSEWMRAAVQVLAEVYGDFRVGCSDHIRKPSLN